MLIQTTQQIKDLYMERSDALDASSYEVMDLCERIEELEADVERLRAAIQFVMASHLPALTGAWTDPMIRIPLGDWLKFERMAREQGGE